jgi:hypothetical protein
MHDAWSSLRELPCFSPGDASRPRERASCSRELAIVAAAFFRVGREIAVEFA